MKPCSDHVWVLGGPIEQWGGSMEKDCVLKGTRYFHSKNTVYLYGPNNREMMTIMSPLDKIVCPLTSINRNLEVKKMPDFEEAEVVSKLSLEYPNIYGGIIDDFDVNLKEFSPARLEKIHQNLKKHNSRLKLHVVVYTWVEHKNYAAYLPFIDVVTLWVWKKSELQTIDRDLESCRRDFPGKPILMGLFIHDYGETDKEATPMDLLKFQLDHIKGYIERDKLQGFIILGDREIAKHPRESEFVRSYVADHII